MEPSAISVQNLLDEQAIRTLSAQFSEAAIRGDLALFRTLWTPDAAWIIHEPFPMAAHGIEAIVKELQTLLAQWEFFVQMLHSGVITHHGDSATAIWVVEEIARSEDHQHHYHNYALYEDHLVRYQGQWRFAQRDYHYRYLDTATLGGTVYALPLTLVEPAG